MSVTFIHRIRMLKVAFELFSNLPTNSILKFYKITYIMLGVRLCPHKKLSYNISSDNAEIWDLRNIWQLLCKCIGACWSLRGTAAGVLCLTRRRRLHLEWIWRWFQGEHLVCTRRDIYHVMAGRSGVRWRRRSGGAESSTCAEPSVQLQLHTIVDWFARLYCAALVRKP